MRTSGSLKIFYLSAKLAAAKLLAEDEDHTDAWPASLDDDGLPNLVVVVRVGADGFPNVADLVRQENDLKDFLAVGYKSMQEGAAFLDYEQNATGGVRMEGVSSWGIKGGGMIHY